MGKNIFRKKKLKKAVIFGSTGLVGSNLIKQLLDHSEYGEVLCFNRKPLGIDHPKYQEVIDDLEDFSKITEKIKGDEVYCCLGTTIKKAGSKEAFERVDLQMPLQIAKICDTNKIQHFLVVSSIGADAGSGNFYLRTKGKMEAAIQKTGIPQKTILRPSMLLGDRKEFRLGEEAGKILMKVVAPLMLGRWKKYRAIQAGTVAHAMIIIANSSPTSQVIFESDEIKEIVAAES